MADAAPNLTPLEKSLLVPMANAVAATVKGALTPGEKDQDGRPLLPRVITATRIALAMRAADESGFVKFGTGKNAGVEVQFQNDGTLRIRVFDAAGANADQAPALSYAARRKGADPSEETTVEVPAPSQPYGRFAIPAALWGKTVRVTESHVGARKPPTVYPTGGIPPADPQIVRTTPTPRPGPTPTPGAMPVAVERMAAAIAAAVQGTLVPGEVFALQTKRARLAPVGVALIRAAYFAYAQADLAPIDPETLKPIPKPPAPGQPGQTTPASPTGRGTVMLGARRFAAPPMPTVIRVLFRAPSLSPNTLVVITSPTGTFSFGANTYVPKALQPRPASATDKTPVGVRIIAGPDASVELVRSKLAAAAAGPAAGFPDLAPITLPTARAAAPAATDGGGLGKLVLVAAIAYAVMQGQGKGKKKR